MPYLFMEPTVYENDTVFSTVKNQADTLLFIGPSTDSAAFIETTPSYLLPYQSIFMDNMEAAFAYLDAYSPVDTEAHLAIIIDARWAEDNRFKLLRTLKNMPVYKHVPVLVVSDRMHWGIGENYMEAGADDYFNCPVEPERLETIVEFLWEHKPAIIDASLAFQQHNSDATVSYKAHPLKRCMDIGGALVGLSLLSPIMLFTALAIRLESKGPIFYCSKRIGAGFKPFNFWKFRSMFTDADQKLTEISHQNQYGNNATFIKIANDPRVTRVGRFIRKYSIDELPQFYNILIGDMSLVGNRPLPVYEADKLFEETSGRRFLGPAGLTGLWQVSKRGRPDMDPQERIKLDIDYVNQQGIVNDARILLRTFTAFVQKENV